MMDRVSHHLGRTALAGLAFVAASYHLTDLARRQAELMRQLQAQQDRATTDQEDGSDESSDSKQILAWFAPDMLDRVCLRAGEQGQRDQGLAGADDEPVYHRDPEQGPRPLVASDVRPSPALSCLVSTRVRLSDRSPHGPPWLG